MYFFPERSEGKKNTRVHLEISSKIVKSTLFCSDKLFYLSSKNTIYAILL